MNHFINLKDIPAKDLKKILIDAKKRKKNRSKLSTLQTDKDAPLKGKLLIQMFEKSSLRTRLSFYLAIKQLGGGTITLRLQNVPWDQALDLVCSAQGAGGGMKREACRRRTKIVATIGPASDQPE